MKLKKSKLQGVVSAPPSKSYTQRAIICSSLADGRSRVINYLDCDDTRETIRACSAYGVTIEERGNTLEITGTTKRRAPLEPIELNGSATCYRFMLPIALLAKGKTIIRGSGRLEKRPIGELISALNEVDGRCELRNGQIEVAGRGYLDGGKIRICGDISSQYISGLLLAYPLAKNDTEITVTTELESKPYVELTLDVLNAFGITVNHSEDLRHFSIPGNQHYKPRDYEIEGDFSSAAFLLAGGAISGDIEVKNLNMNSKQGDREILNILEQMGAKVERMQDSVRVKVSDLRGIEIDARDIPDLVPICAVLGCFADGETRIANANRLRIKESDRLRAITQELRKMGADIRESGGGLIINGRCKLKGAVLDPHDDHRIAMSCAIAALSAEGETVIENPECVRKSYPNFFEDLEKLGASIDWGEEG